jgi:two-component system, OmpR family, phosphate regulon sensor histidine kinase PhoR
MKRQTSIIFYILGVYVVLQFVWWGFHLIELTSELDADQNLLSKRVTMIIGEGLVFFLILILGLWKIQNSIRKELRLAERQKNFLLSVTHELKTPLAANKLFWQTIEKRELTLDQKKEIVQQALQENNRLEQLIDNILNASRIENKALQLVKEPLELSELIQQIADRFQKRNPEVSVHLELDKNVFIQSDRFLIETVLGNLIENAIKYGGPQPKITCYLSKVDKGVKFGVKDEGPGIPTDKRKAIFTKFFRGENEETRSQKGTGLGLFITSEFIKILGGTINYHENKPTGSNFEITLAL